MNKNLSLFIFLTTLWVSNILAQSYNDGVRSFFNLHYTQALSTMQKVVNDDPNNEMAIYYLGQAYIKMGNLDAAQKLYEDALNNNKKLAKSGIISAGLGHVLLFKGDPIQARSKFEEAITFQKKVDESDVLGAIGFANLDPQKKIDLKYAVEVLERATQAKKINSSKVYVFLGIAYKMLHDGSKSVQAFSNATRMNATEAEAYYWMGKIFATQNNVDVFLDNYYKAIVADPEYFPTYLELYGYYFNNLKIDSAQKYLALYDKTVEKIPSTQSLIDMFKAEILFLKKEYNASLIKANAVKADATNPQERAIAIRKLRVQALNQEALGKKQEAFSSISNYIDAIEKTTEDVEASDYLLYARILLNTDSTTRAQYFSNLLQKSESISNDVVVKARFLTKIEDLCDKSSATREVALTKLKKLKINSQPTNNDFFDVGYAFFSAGMYPQADSLLSIYVKKEPDQPFGYFWLASTNLILDTTYKKAKPLYEKYIEIAEKKMDDNKNGLIRAYSFMGGYYSRPETRDVDKAISWWSKALVLDPGNARALKVKASLEKHKKDMEEYKRRQEEYKKQLQEVKSSEE